jgi:Mg2+/Co2+ transporter CorB
MTTAFWIICGAIVLCIVVSGFFAGSETALTAASRARMHSLEHGGSPKARMVNALIDHRDRLIGALLIGNNLANILASSLATSIFLDIFGARGVAYSTAAMTVLLVIFAEVLPKSWAISTPDRFSLAVAPLVRAFVFVVGPLAALVNAIVRFVLRLFRVGLQEHHSLLSAHEELRGTAAVLHREGSFVKLERDRLGGLLDLTELEVSDVMVHRTGMLSVNADQPADVIVRDVLQSPYTRVPLWRGSTENIVGVVHAKDILRALNEAGNDPAKIDILKVATKPWFVPDTTSLADQLNAFLRRKSHFAVVVDEYGEVEGMVTLEDIIEEIVGEIADEHDIEMQGVRQEADGSVVVEGSVPIRDLNRALDWHLPDDEATTIAGLVIHETQTIPDEKQAFTFHGMRFIVMKRDKNRITRLRIKPLAEPAAAAPPPERKS